MSEEQKKIIRLLLGWVWLPETTPNVRLPLSDPKERVRQDPREALRHQAEESECRRRQKGKQTARIWNLKQDPAISTSKRAAPLLARGTFPCQVSRMVCDLMDSLPCRVARNRRLELVCSEERIPRAAIHGTDDLLGAFGLVGLYDEYVRPYMRPVGEQQQHGGDPKGKGKAVEDPPQPAGAAPQGPNAAGTKKFPKGYAHHVADLPGKPCQ